MTPLHYRVVKPHSTSATLGEYLAAASAEILEVYGEDANRPEPRMGPGCSRKAPVFPECSR